MAHEPQPDEMVYYDRDELSNVRIALPETGWMDTPVDLRPGSFIYPAKGKHLEYLGMANPRQWAPADQDWKLPSNWKEIIIDGIRERLDKYRSFQVFMDICVRCGACSDKCHFYIGGGDPKNMPIRESQLLDIAWCPGSHGSRRIVLLPLPVEDRADDYRLVPGRALGLLHLAVHLSRRHRCVGGGADVAVLPT